MTDCEITPDALFEFAASLRGTSVEAVRKAVAAELGRVRVGREALAELADAFRTRTGRDYTADRLPTVADLRPDAPPALAALVRRVEQLTAEYRRGRGRLEAAIAAEWGKHLAVVDRLAAEPAGAPVALAFDRRPPTPNELL
jgi:hypothetical protein